MKPNRQMIQFVTINRVMEVPRTGKCNEPWQLVEFWRDHIATRPDFDRDKEHLYVFALSTKHDIKGVTLVTMGTLNESLFHPREVYRPAVAMGAFGIVLMHNHPSGDSTPSDADHTATRITRAAGEVLKIALIDHVIYGSPESYFSFRTSGLL